MKFELNKLAKFPLLPNSKLPACKWSDKTHHIYDNHDKSKNYGLITGKLNNLLVLDIDVQDHGLDEWNTYLKGNGDIDTLTVATPSGGFHYYFLFHSKNEANEQLLRDHLYTQTKLRNAGLDIRSDGGYVVAPDSCINNKRYTYVKNDRIREMPTELILWLLEGHIKVKPTKPHTVKTPPLRQPTNDLVYMLTDDRLVDILNRLPQEYCDNYLKWLSITSVLKGLYKQEIWTSWSKKSKKYNKANNISIWNQQNSFLDVNYMIHIINNMLPNQKLELVESYKPYQPFTANLKEDFHLREFNKEYVSDEFQYEEFEHNSTIIVESCTGTEKTTATARYFKTLHDSHPHLRMLSLVNKISLANQHVTSFTEAGVKMVSYKEVPKNIYTDHLVVCINSIRILQDLPLEVLQNQVVYIDEVNSFLESLTHNDTLVNDVRTIFLTLAKIIKCAHKVILSDALMNDGILCLLKWRAEFSPQKPLFVRNAFKKYQNVEAIQLNNEDTFLQQLLHACKTENGFLFGCDSKTTITEYYHRCFNEATKNEQEKFLLITADSKRKIEDASVEFKDKFVFYSPSITTGVDFSIAEKQNVYIYINGKSILSNSIFQQTTRTRNIRSLYYYCNKTRHSVNFSCVEDVETHYTELLNITQKALHDVCVQVDENDQQTVIKNTFFKLFCYNEYVREVYKSNIKVHFEQLLRQNGFVLSAVGNKKKLDKAVKSGMKEIAGEVKGGTFDEFIKASDSNRTKAKYNHFNDRIKILNLSGANKEELPLYQNEISNEKDFKSHLNFCRLLQREDYLKAELDKKQENSYDIVQLTSTINKILHIRKLEETFQIGFLNVSFPPGNEESIQFEDALFKVIKTLFRTEKGKPKTINEVKKLYLSMLKNITGVKFIQANKINKKKDQNIGKYTYVLDDEVIRYHIRLMLKRYAVTDKDDLDRFHEGALKYLPKFDKQYYFGTRAAR